MVNLLSELKRRHIFRVAAAYAVVAWVLLQLVANVSPILDLPPWIGRTVLLLLVIGFPVALLFAWIHQLAPTDVVAASADGAPAPATIGRLDWGLMGALVVVILLVSYQQIAPAGDRTARGEQQATVAAARQASLSPSGAISIAVLPFTNLSADPEQEFFSAGMTEEITTALAKIADLRVVARTSAFQFKDQNRDIQAIAQTLRATHLIEGSVRRAGTRLRISAQLINADSGLSIWTDSYDRELADVFSIQEDIARAIAASLRMPLGLKPGERLVSDRPVDQETYDLYLRGRAAVRARTRQELELLEQVVARDPNFAPGWAWLGEARREMAIYFERQGEQSKVRPLVDGAETAARKSIALAPGYAGGYGVLAGVTARRGKWAESMDIFRQGLALDPEDPELLRVYGGTLYELGYLKEALAIRDRVFLLEPLIPLYNRQRAEALLANGNADAGLSELIRLDRQGNAGVFLVLPAAYAQQGRFMEAADVLQQARAAGERLGLAPPLPSSPFAAPLVEAAVQALRAVANQSDPPARLPDFYSELHFVHAHTSQPERMLEWPERNLKAGDYRLAGVWWPTPSGVRKTERFKTLVRNAGLVDYWRARGWPDLCRPVGADDFVCD